MYSYLLFYSLLFINSSFVDEENNINKREIASKTTCHEFIEPFLESLKYVENYDDIFKKGHLSHDEVSEIKASPVLKTLVEKNSIEGEDQDFAYAVLAFLKKKYPNLNEEDISLHYEAILRFCI